MNISFRQFGLGRRGRGGPPLPPWYHDFSVFCDKAVEYDPLVTPKGDFPDWEWWAKGLRVQRPPSWLLRLKDKFFDFDGMAALGIIVCVGIGFVLGALSIWLGCGIR